MVTNSLARVTASLQMTSITAKRLVLEEDPQFVKAELDKMVTDVEGCLKFLNEQDPAHRPGTFMAIVKIELKEARKLHDQLMRMIKSARLIQEKDHRRRPSQRFSSAIQ